MLQGETMGDHGTLTGLLSPCRTPSAASQQHQQRTGLAGSTGRPSYCAEHGAECPVYLALLATDTPRTLGRV